MPLPVTTIPYRFLVRGGTAAAVAALNERPKYRELVVETDTRRMKLGNGIDNYLDLPYFDGGGAVVGSQIGYAYAESSTPASSSFTIPFDNTKPQSNEGAAYPSLDLTYTPLFASSLLEVEYDFALVSGNGTIDVTWALFRDSGTDAIRSQVVTVDANNFSRSVRLRRTVAAGSTSPTTFKPRFGRSGSTAYINQVGAAAAIHDGVLLATATVREIKQ